MISNNHGVHELPHKLPNDLRLKKNQENLKTYDNYKLVPSLPDKMKVILILNKSSWKIDIKLFPYGAISHEN